MKRIIRIVAILLLFVVFPLTSWYYLKQGAQWRRTALNELEYIAKIRASHLIDANGKDINLLERRVCMLYMIEGTEDSADYRKGLEICGRIYDQFNARPELRIVIVSPSTDLSIKQAISEQKGAGSEFWVHDGAMGAWKTILYNAMDSYTHKHQLPKFKNYMALSDIEGNIKCVYNFDDDAQVKRMVQHLAILLPFK
jgi:hypothetical protein